MTHLQGVADDDGCHELPAIAQVPGRLSAAVGRDSQQLAEPGREAQAEAQHGRRHALAEEGALGEDGVDVERVQLPGEIHEAHHVGFAERPDGGDAPRAPIEQVLGGEGRTGGRGLGTTSGPQGLGHAIARLRAVDSGDRFALDYNVNLGALATRHELRIDKDGQGGTHQMWVAAGPFNFDSHLAIGDGATGGYGLKCFGHQLLAHALGGQVRDNPRGVEVGTVTTQFASTADTDGLCTGLVGAQAVQASHRQSVIRLPSGAIRLASSAKDPHHAFRIGRCAWGLQFHPEFDRRIVTAYAHYYQSSLQAQGEDASAIAAAAEETPLIAGLLARFAAGLLTGF